MGCVGPYPTLLNESKNAQPPRTSSASTIGMICFGLSALKSPETGRLGSLAARGHPTDLEQDCEYNHQLLGRQARSRMSRAPKSRARRYDRRAARGTLDFQIHAPGDGSL